MAKKKRNVSQFDFGKVASGNDSNINNDLKKNKDISIDVASESNMIDDILKDHQSKDKTHVFKGFYLENEVAGAIDTATYNKGKGAKSELVNEILKRYFKEAGRL